MSITSLSTTGIFRDWFDKTNEIIDTLNTKAVVHGITAYGAFVIGSNANTSLAVMNNFTVNTSTVGIRANLAISSNTTVNSSANVVNLAPVTLILQPINGTIVNTVAIFNDTASFLGPLSANANVTITNGLTTFTGNLLVTGSATMNGVMAARQVIFSLANSSVSPSALTNPQYDDYTTAGLADAQILNLTPNIDTVFTGITSPSLAGGGRVLYIQNLSGTYKITLTSQNTSSTSTNRFSLDSDIVIQPNMTVQLLYSAATNRWRYMGGVGSGTANVTIPNTFATLTVTGNTSLNVLAVSGLTTVSNLSITGNITGIVNLTNTVASNSTSENFLRVLRTANLTVTGTLTANVPASSISGVVNPVNLGTGTPNAAVSLLGDGSWGPAVPAGVIMPYAGTVAPPTYYFCDGTMYSKTTEARLFAAIGTTYGSNATHFAVPDIRQKFVLGKAVSGTGSTLGSTGGAIDHVHTGPSHTHTYTDVIAHVHIDSRTFSVDVHHGGGGTGPTRGGIEDGTISTNPQSDTIPVQPSDTVIPSPAGAVSTGTTSASGTGNTGSANPPYIVLNYIIKA